MESEKQVGLLAGVFETLWLDRAVSESGTMSCNQPCHHHVP